MLKNQEVKLVNDHNKYITEYLNVINKIAEKINDL